MAMSTSANVFNVETESRMIRMGRKGIEWTVAMIEKMLAEYAITFDRVLAEELHVSINSVRRKAKKLQLSKQYKGRKNMVARKIVLENFHVMSYQQLARLARIDIRSVVNIVIEYDLTRTEEEISFMKSKGVKAFIKSERVQLPEADRAYITDYGIQIFIHGRRIRSIIPVYGEEPQFKDPSDHFIIQISV